MVRYSHQADDATSDGGFEAGDQGVDKGHGPDELPGGPRLPDLHDDGGDGGGQVEDGVQDEGPCRGEPPGVPEGVDGVGFRLGRPVQEGEAGDRVAGRRVVMTLDTVVSEAVELDG